MAIRDEDFGSALTLVEGDDGLWSPPATAPACAPPDLHLLYEQELNRAKSAEARVQELLNDTRRLRRALRKTEAGGRTACPGRSARVPDDRPKPPPPTRRRHRAPAPAKSQQETIKLLRGERGELRKEVTRLNKKLDREAQSTEKHKETIRRQFDEDIKLRAELRRRRDQADRVRSLTDEAFWLRLALEGAQARKRALQAKLAKLLTERKTLSKPIAGPQLRAALRRSRHQKKTIQSQSKEIRRLRGAVRASEVRRRGQRILAPLDAVDGFRRAAPRLLGRGIAVASQSRPSRATGAPALDHIVLQARGIHPDPEAR